MNTLFQNAIDSIQLGVEDYQANDPKRATPSSRPRSLSSAGVITITTAGPIRPSATSRQLRAHGSSRRRTPAPLRYGYAGVRLDQNPVPLLHKTRLRNREPVKSALLMSDHGPFARSFTSGKFLYGQPKPID